MEKQNTKNIIFRGKTPIEYKIYGKFKVTENGYLLDDNLKFIHLENFKKLEGKIQKGWEIHHCNGDKKNNEISNLVQIPKLLHVYIHAKGEYPSKNEINNRILPEFLEGWIKPDFCPAIKIPRKSKNAKEKERYRFNLKTGKTEKVDPPRFRKVTKKSAKKAREERKARGYFSGRPWLRK